MSPKSLVYSCLKNQFSHIDFWLYKNWGLKLVFHIFINELIKRHVKPQLILHDETPIAVNAFHVSVIHAQLDDLRRYISSHHTQ